MNYVLFLQVSTSTSEVSRRLYFSSGALKHGLVESTSRIRARLKCSSMIASVSVSKEQQASSLSQVSRIFCLLAYCEVSLFDDVEEVVVSCSCEMTFFEYRLTSRESNSRAPWIKHLHKSICKKRRERQRHEERRVSGQCCYSCYLR